MFTLSQQQLEALQAIKAFIRDDNKSVFILKGYAGTGKTTMIKTIIPELQKIRKIVKLMAPTGRAAKVLQDKTGFKSASTIHKVIYYKPDIRDARHDEEGKKIKSEIAPSLRADGVDDLQLYFGIRALENGETPDRLVCIVDESSMICSRKATDEVLHFGTDILLDDLLTYGNPHKGAKFIFVGDPAQLPPVGDNRSAALDKQYFEKIGLSVDSYELTQVLRQSEGSAILANAMKIRDLLNTTERSELSFDRVEGEVEDITGEQTIERFFEEYPTPRLGSSVVICYSNALVRDYNDAIRHNYFEDINIPHVGDVIQIIRNSHIHELYNGDFAQITAVDEGIEIQSAPVWTTIGKEKKRVNIELTFRNVDIIIYDGRTLRCKIVDSLLHNSNHGLTPQETTALYINFRMRNPNLKSRSEVSQGLQEDPYFNALCVKYGYAITCHKAQGGEWPTVFVDYHGRTGLNDDSLHWSYTATTRASKILYGVLMPKMQLLDRLKINPITKVPKPQKDCIRVACMGNIEDLPANATDSQKAKFLSVKTALSKLGLYINKVEFYQYVDRYYIQSSEGERIYNLQYNGMGMYTSVKALSLYPDDDIVQEALMSECEYFYDVCYSSEATSLMKLYHKMVSYCDDLGILITNITNAQYQVIYHLKTSGMFSSIHFFYNAKKLISYAVPLSDMGAVDEKLIQLIEKLRN